MTESKNLEAVGVTVVSILLMIFLPLFALGKLSLDIQSLEWNFVDTLLSLEVLRLAVLLGFLALATFIVVRVAKLAWKDKEQKIGYKN